MAKRNRTNQLKIKFVAADRSNKTNFGLGDAAQLWRIDKTRILTLLKCSGEMIPVSHIGFVTDSICMHGESLSQIRRRREDLIDGAAQAGFLGFNQCPGHAGLLLDCIHRVVNRQSEALQRQIEQCQRVVGPQPRRTKTQDPTRK